MSAVNPYQPPQAAIGDGRAPGGGFSTPKVWAAAGRIGRLRYLAYLMVGYVVMVLAAGAVGAILGAAGARPEVGGIVGVLVAIPYVVMSVLVHIQRAHDMDWTGWSVLLCLIPLVSLIWMFKRGSAGANRFGEPPPANGTGVLLGALLMPAVMVVGILAAVALPAYNDYTKRAKARQAQSQSLPPSDAGQSDGR